MQFTSLISLFWIRVANRYQESELRWSFTLYSKNTGIDPNSLNSASKSKFNNNHTGKYTKYYKLISVKIDKPNKEKNTINTVHCL